MNNIEVVKKVIAKNNFEFGDEIITLKGLRVKDRTKTSIEFNGANIESSNGLDAMNHACFPNAKWNFHGVLIAQRPIYSGYEITFDYQENESKISYPFTCHCGHHFCRGWIE